MPPLGSFDLGQSAQPVDHGLPVTVDVNGEDRRLVAIFGFEDPTELCAEEPAPTPSGVIQIVETPSGNFSEVVHNGDIPVNVFDVTDIEDEAQFFFLLCTGRAEPLASGTAKQRPIISGDDTGFTQKITSMGIVTDSQDRDWKLHAFLKADVVFGEPPQVDLKEWIKLTPR